MIAVTDDDYAYHINHGNFLDDNDNLIFFKTSNP